MELVERQGHLMEVILTLSRSGGSANLLHGGQQQCDEDANDRDDNQQLNQSKSSVPGPR
jgi:hypothetical protein